MTITEIIERLERGETGQELWAECLRLAGHETQHRHRDSFHFWEWKQKGSNVWQWMRDGTESIDAQAALPGRIVEVIWVSDEPGLPATDCHAYADGPAGEPLPSGRAPTEPAARLAALLRAMEEPK